MKLDRLIVILVTLSACQSASSPDSPGAAALPLKGTWQLVTATLIEKGDTTVTDYTNKISFIKILNDSHFAFLQHDLNKGKDSSAVFVAGGGSYSLKDSTYTEHLEYCSARDWEGHDFSFTIEIKNDTLVQRGREIVETAGINRINIEKYFRIKK